MPIWIIPGLKEHTVWRKFNPLTGVVGRCPNKCLKGTLCWDILGSKELWLLFHGNKYFLLKFLGNRPEKLTAQEQAKSVHLAISICYISYSFSRQKVIKSQYKMQCAYVDRNSAQSSAEKAPLKWMNLNLSCPLTLVVLLGATLAFDPTPWFGVSLESLLDYNSYCSQPA